MRLFHTHVVFFLIWFGLIGIPEARSQARIPCSCCTQEFQQFDFWIGEWEVKDTNGVIQGENSIAKVEGDCLLTEHWRGSSGGTGRSFNFYDQADSTWNQLWVSSNGTVLRLKGNPSHGAMVLKSEPVVHPQGNFHHRITWTPQSDGSVLQVWEMISESGGQVVGTLFYGVYRRKG